MSALWYQLVVEVPGEVKLGICHFNSNMKAIVECFNKVRSFRLLILEFNGTFSGDLSTYLQKTLEGKFR